MAQTPEKIFSLLPLLDEQIADEFDNKNLKASIIEQVRQMLVNPGNPDVYIFEAETNLLVYDLFFPTEDETVLMEGKA